MIELLNYKILKALAFPGKARVNKDFALLNIWMYNECMDNIFKAIITAGVTNLVTNNLILAISLGWLIYLYESNKNEKRV